MNYSNIFLIIAFVISFVHSEYTVQEKPQTYNVEPPIPAEKGKESKGTLKSIEESAAPLLKALQPTLQNIAIQQLLQSLNKGNAKAPEVPPTTIKPEVPKSTLDNIQSTLQKIDVQALLQRVQSEDLKPILNKAKEGDYQPLIQKIQSEAGPVLLNSWLKNMQSQQRQKRDIKIDCDQALPGKPPAALH